MPFTMPPQAIVCLPDISEQVSDDGQVMLDFLMPNGVFLQLNIGFHIPLDLLKQTLWESVRNYPLYERLKGKDNYFFEFLNRDGEMEEVSDENLRLSELCPIGKYLRLRERKYEEGTHIIDRQISTLLGSKVAMEMYAMSRTEVDHFRKKMYQYALSKAPKQNDSQTVLEAKFPPQLRNSSKLSPELHKKLDKDSLSVIIKIPEMRLYVPVNVMDTPEKLVDSALAEWYNRPMKNNYEYILKVLGQEEFLYGEHQLVQFKYIYNCLQRNVAPEFCLVKKSTLLGGMVKPARPPRFVVMTNASVHNDVLVWDIEDNFEVTVDCIQNIEITSDQVKDNIEKVKLFVGLYHGIEVLGDVRTTSEIPVVGGSCIVKMTLTFDLQVKDVQTASRLCFTLHGRLKGSKSLNPIAWVNIPVFDFQSRLLVGEHKYAMWPVTAELQLEETGCYPLGSVSRNPHNTVMLTVSFCSYNRNPPIVFPHDNRITQCVADHMEQPGSAGHPDWHPPHILLSSVEALINSNKWECLHENDKEMLWMMRIEIRDKYPYALPLVLKSVKWNSYIDVAKMQFLLSTWRKKIPVDHALELLDFNFPDKCVRKYAVDCLQDLGDDEVSLYLLQMVQALKYENYLYCPLAEFLMERALHNQHIGQQLFWLLKSELHNPKVTVRFSLLLETYLRVVPDHLSMLYRQFEALNKLNALSQLVKSDKIKDERSTEQAITNLRTVLAQKTYQDTLSNLLSPLSPLHRLGRLRTETCRFMDSKKRPLYLVWSNSDPDGREIHIIYKNGDDLRQDMLTLQMLQVMDSIWQAENLDLRMTAYGCIATGFEQGMIEVVRHATTVAKIQIKANSALDKATLFEWLREKNGNGAQLDRAIEEFIRSCAGYTVATYVLGIGDRHNDNIMLKDTGQLFHIDFGHFLGNFKSKYGFKRERVPFVLSSHFVYVITRGEKEGESANYRRFEDYCVRAYLALRRRGHLLIRLFMMMLTSGIPQLTSVSDLDYLKDTLALHLSEEEARRHLLNKMAEACNSISTSLNWLIHIMAHPS